MKLLISTQVSVCEPMYVFVGIFAQAFIGMRYTGGIVGGYLR